MSKIFNIILKSKRLPLICAPMYGVTDVSLLLAQLRNGLIGSNNASNINFDKSNFNNLDEELSFIHNFVQAMDIDQNSPHYNEIYKYSKKTGINFHNPYNIYVSNSDSSEYLNTIATLEKYKVPIITLSNTVTKQDIKHAKSYGALIIQAVYNMQDIKNSIDNEVDAIAVTANGGGGFVSQINPFAFMTAVKKIFNGCIILGSGMSTGHCIAGAIAMGANGALMGTKFIASIECKVNEKYKNMIVDSSIDDIFYTDKFTGYITGYLKKSINEKFYKDNFSKDEIIKNFNDDFWKSMHSAGQSVAGVSAIESISDITDKLEREFNESMEFSMSYKK